MRVVASPEHYPDFSKLPPLPVLGSVSNNLASPGRHEESVENGDEAVIVDAGPPGATAAAAAEVLLNASRLKVESET